MFKINCNLIQKNQDLSKCLEKLKSSRSNNHKGIIVSSLPATESGALVGLRHLSLADKGFEQISETIFQKTSLTQLNLSGNALTQVPQELKSLSLLRSLDISHNKLNGEISISLEKLQKLVVNSNRIDRFIVTTTMLYLHTLDLSKNNLTALPEKLCKLAVLTKLDLSDNVITQLSVELFSLITLETLILKENRLAELPEAINGLKKLKVLNVSCNQLTTLPNSLRKLTQLETLDLSNNALTALSAHMAFLLTIPDLNLSGNKWTVSPFDLLTSLTDT
jgi:Leucine-rich repeat (LRR) protein